MPLNRGIYRKQLINVDCSTVSHDDLGGADES